MLLNVSLCEQALERGYRVDFCEPDTSWKYDPYELEKYEFLLIIKCALTDFE